MTLMRMACLTAAGAAAARFAGHSLTPLPTRPSPRQQRVQLEGLTARIARDSFTATGSDDVLALALGALLDALGCDGGRALRTGPRESGYAALMGGGFDTPVARELESSVGRTGATMTATCGRWTYISTPVLCSGSSHRATVTVRRRGRRFSEWERELVGVAARQAAAALEVALRLETLHRLALTDELTGLANYRRFQELLSRAAASSDGVEPRRAVVLIDIDDFKTINDSEGHEAGDAVLRWVAEQLRESCRAQDEPARCGGDELAIVLSNIDPREALALAERCRVAISRGARPGRIERVPVTVSVGLGLGDVMSTGRDLMRLADAALYDAKRGGKNRVRARSEAGRVPGLYRARPRLVVP